MPLYRKKPITVSASLWYKNGDHPEDGDPTKQGEVVQYHRTPGTDQLTCKHCSRIMYDHGWIDTLEGGHIVCPGDFIITGTQGEYYPCKPDIFRKTYNLVE